LGARKAEEMRSFRSGSHRPSTEDGGLLRIFREGWLLSSPKLGEALWNFFPLLLRLVNNQETNLHILPNGACMVESYKENSLAFKNATLCHHTRSIYMRFLIKSA
jgi:hypothetical protein